eukprot:m.119911 g.119911  ORF g.119911 m.119911 type:complete len:111 (+) comp9365_c1_seq1:1009-1341(+)
MPKPNRSVCVGCTVSCRARLLYPKRDVKNIIPNDYSDGIVHNLVITSMEKRRIVSGMYRHCWIMKSKHLGDVEVYVPTHSSFTNIILPPQPSPPHAMKMRMTRVNPRQWL